MPKRRARGEGTIYQRPDGLWCAQITLPDGKRRTKYGKVQSKVRTWLNEQQGAVGRGAWSSDTDLTVAEYLTRYMADVVAPNVRAQTLHSYQGNLDRHVLPTLGKTKLSSLRPEHLQRLYASLSEGGMAPGTILIIHGILRQALKKAEQWNLIGRDPTALAKPPRRQEKKPVMLDAEQLRTLLDSTRGHWLYALIMLAVTTGLRRGELIALSWDDVDLEKRLLTVRKGVVKIDRDVKLADPKTATSKRRVTIPPAAVEALIEHREYMEQRAGAYRTWGGTNLIFPNRSGGIMGPATVNTMWDLKLKQLGLPHFTFHSLRHLSATILLSAGVSAKVIQERLGHSSVAVTLGIYSHVTASLESQAADVMERAISTTA